MTTKDEALKALDVLTSAKPSLAEYYEARTALLNYIESTAQPAAADEVADAARVIEWARDPNRKPASTAFTRGAERQAAYWIEWAENNHSRGPAADEPVAGYVRDINAHTSVFVKSAEYRSAAEADAGVEYTPVYTRPLPEPDLAELRCKAAAYDALNTPQVSDFLAAVENEALKPVLEKDGRHWCKNHYPVERKERSNG